MVTYTGPKPTARSIHEAAVAPIAANQQAQRTQQTQVEALNKAAAGTGEVFQRSGTVGNKGTTITSVQYDPNGTGIIPDSGQKTNITMTNQNTGQNSNLVNPFLTTHTSAPITSGPTNNNQPVSTIAQSSYDRIKRENPTWTDQQIQKQMDSSATAAGSTMTNTGLGASFDPKTGMVVPGSGRLPQNSTVSKNPAADAAKAKAAASAATVANTKGYVPFTTTDANGNTTTTYSEDPGATANAQNAAKTAEANNNLAGEMQANTYSDWLKANTPTPPSDTFYTNLPPDQRADAQQTYGPMFDYIDKSMAMLRGNQQSGEDAIGQVGGAMQTYVDSQRARDSAMLDRFDNFYKEQLNNQLSAADSTRDAQTRDQNLARDRAASEFDRAIRDQMIQNEKNRKDQLLGLGVSGGWRSSRHSADVIDALSTGDRILSDLSTQKAFMERDFGNKFSDIESDWHGNVVSANDKYKAASLTLLDKAMTKAGDLDKIVYQNNADKINAIQKLKEDFVHGYGLLAKDFASTVVDYNKDVIKKAADVEKMQYDRRNDMFTNAFKYIDTYGTQNKAALRVYEDGLNLMPGALSDQRTLEELRLKSSGGGSGTPGSIASHVDDKVKEIQNIYPNANLNDVLTMAYHELNDEIGGESNAGRAHMDQAKQYMYGNYGKQLPTGTRIETILNKTTKNGVIQSTYEDAKNNAFYGNSVNGPQGTQDQAVKMYQKLKDSIGSEDASTYMKQFGWEISDPYGPNFWPTGTSATKNK